MQLPEKHLHTSRSSLIFNSPSQTHVSQYFTTSFFSAPEGRQGNQSISV
jgi:hypothetical protein